ncbi:MAG: TIGR02300 family protein, partial [Pseudomonadota bacterium]|nr:TIGR02300 family protein [Pseudomonadota bacterium]
MQGCFGEAILAQSDLGIKRICQACGARYFDLNKQPIVCPACGTPFDPEAILKSR